MMHFYLDFADFASFTYMYRGTKIYIALVAFLAGYMGSSQKNIIGQSGSQKSLIFHLQNCQSTSQPAGKALVIVLRYHIVTWYKSGTNVQVGNEI